MQKPVLILATLILTCAAHALTDKNVYIFKGDKSGNLRLYGNPHNKSSLEAAAIIGGEQICGKLEINKLPKPKVSKEDAAMNSDPICKPNYEGKYNLNKKHKFSDREFPIALGFDTCSIKPLRMMEADKETLEKFKAEQKLPKYLYEQTKIFSGADGAKYLWIIGLKAKTTKGKDPELLPIEIDGVVKRDFLLYDLVNKKPALDKRDQVCCDPATANAPCSFPNIAQGECFRPYRTLETFQGLISDGGKLYSYAVDPVMEGLAATIGQIENNTQKRIFLDSFYGLEGCK